MPRKSAKKLLENVVCCVDTKNDDGSDASNQTKKVLQDLGAQVESGGIRMGLTHMIWSNGNIKMVKAAEFMDVIVVSPLWVEQCREAGKRVPEEGFIVSPDGGTNAPSSSKKVLPIPVANVADEFEEPDMFSSSQRIMANEVKGKEKRVGKRAGVISRKKSAAVPASTNTSSSANNKLNSEKEKHENTKLVSGIVNEKTAPNSNKGRKSSDVSTNGSSKGKRKDSPVNSSTHDGVAAHSSPPSSTAADISPKLTNQTLKRRRQSSKQSASDDDDCDDDAVSMLPGSNSEDVKLQKGSSSASSTKKAKKSVSTSTPETASVAASASSSKKAVDVTKAANTTPKVTKKKQSASNAKKSLVNESTTARQSESKAVEGVGQKSAPNVSTKSNSSTATAVVRDNSSSVLSVSGFSHDERGLLEDIIVSLISKHPKGKSKTKSKAKDAGVDQERQVTLQQADPQMELQLIKALGSVTHVVTPDEAANSNRTLRILFAMARGVPVLTPVRLSRPRSVALVAGRLQGLSPPAFQPYS